MSWSVPPQQHKVFERNPLVAVVVELRYHPILKIADRIADYQERVRATFPVFQEVTSQHVNMGPLAPVEVRTERLFNMRKQDGYSALSVSKASLSLESRRHESRQNFISDAKVGIDALVELHGPVVPTRLGLRYVDLIDKAQIEQDLGRTTEWSQLVSEAFLQVPTGLADFDGALFACEVAAPMTSGGAMTVRYGLVQDADGRVKYRLDVDRYVEGVFDASQLVDLLGRFADDVFAVFIAAMGPDLRAWMPEKTT